MSFKCGDHRQKDITAVSMLRLLEAPWAIGAKVGWYTGLRVSWSEEDAKSWIYTIFEVCHGVMVSGCHSLLYTGLWSAVSNRWPGKMDCWTTGGWIFFKIVFWVYFAVVMFNTFCVQHIFSAIQHFHAGDWSRGSAGGVSSFVVVGD